MRFGKIAGARLNDRSERKMDHVEDLRLRAYYLWEAAGRPEGRADEHWDQACRDLGLDAKDKQSGSALAANELINILNAKNIALLEVQLLPQYLSRRRWFAAKDRSIDSLRLVTPSTELIGDVGLLAQIEVTIAGNIERYSLPLTVVWNGEGYGEDDLGLARDMAIALVRGQDRTGFLTDAFFVPGFIRGLLDKTKAGESISSSGEGKLDILLESGAQETIDAGAEIRWLSTEQSNSSVIVGGRIVMKLMRRLQPGTHPEAEMCRFLTQVGYGNSSPLLAEIVHRDREHTARTMLVLEGAISNDGDAWTYAIECLCNALMKGDLVSREFEQLAGRVGRRLGELHTALSKGDGNAAFASEAAGARDIEAWKNAAVVQLEEALDTLERQRSQPAVANDPLAKRIIENRDKILTVVHEAPLSDPRAAKTRIHGDFHLGQVLRAREDIYIIDFEGEPAKPIESRRAKSSPLRDVAGFLRSLSYATALAARQHESSFAANKAESEARLDASRQAAEKSFLDAYARARNGEGLSVAKTEAVSLLNLFLVEKAAYEVCYEGANRPEWIAVPMQGLARELAAFPELAHLCG
jgi:maltose alpha-D-glucosyltransferase/alpha-amylase